MNLFVLALLIVASSIWFVGRRMYRTRRLEPRVAMLMNKHQNILVVLVVVALVGLFLLGLFGLGGAIYGQLK